MKSKVKDQANCKKPSPRERVLADMHVRAEVLKESFEVDSEEMASILSDLAEWYGGRPMPLILVERGGR